MVPHFEKMLYDNALLLRVYLHLWRATGERWARRIADETAAFLIRDLGTPEGGFASALDADTDGVEGLTYVWTPDQLIEVLGADDGRWAADAFEVTDHGTFEHGTSTLQLAARRRRPGAAGRRCGSGSWPPGRGGRSRPATTRSSPRGTGSRSPRSPSTAS